MVAEVRVSSAQSWREAARKAGRGLWLGVGYEGSGETREAIPEYQKAVELSQGDSDPTAALAHACATTGGKAEGWSQWVDATLWSNPTSIENKGYIARLARSAGTLPWLGFDRV
jgi:hypothetical protein